MGLFDFLKKKEIEEIKQLILDEQYSQVGIVGVGGIGKSIIASETVQSNEIREQFENVYSIDISKKPNTRELVIKLLEFNILKVFYFSLFNFYFFRMDLKKFMIIILLHEY